MINHTSRLLKFEPIRRKMNKVLITGAAGNLGSLLTRHMLDDWKDLHLILMEHHKKIPTQLRDHSRITVRGADLAIPETLDDCVQGTDVIVHFAGLLFKANPEKFLHQTNTQYFKNLVAAAKKKHINKVILISFPHVEGPTSRTAPASGRLDGNPISVHAATRLEEEKHLLAEIDIPVILRVGMVYGSGILMIDAAKWFAQKGLLGVWKEPTQIHLVSKTDFCRAVVAAARNPKAMGIYHVGDEGVDTLQSFLDWACRTWSYGKPRRIPVGFIYAAAEVCELASRLFGIKSPLTRDFIDIGRVPYYGDTTRFRAELLPHLKYPTIYDGVEEMRAQRVLNVMN